VVKAKVHELTGRGCRLDGTVEQLDGYFIAACYDYSMKSVRVQGSLW